MNPPLRIGIAGLGTVGATVVKLLAEHATALELKTGRALRVVAVAARDRGKDRGVDLAPYRWYERAEDMAASADIDVVVEAIGGAEGTARRVIDTAIARGRHVVTANKALLALHGHALATAAEAAGVALAFEAAIAGGIPIVKMLREGLAANRLSRVYGILNGTCNYILTKMRASVLDHAHRGFADVLGEAQALGYAEADPSFDVDGIDAAHKLALLAALAFGCRVDFASVHVEGIRHILPLDIAYARELGYDIKLLGIARATEEGVEQRVHPCMVPLDTPIAHVDGPFNAVVAEGDYVGRIECEGRGAGGGPTASAVVSDLIDLARGHRVAPFAVPASALTSPPRLPMERRFGPYYVRLMVLDRPGVLAEIAACFRDEQVSMEGLLQRGRAPGENVPLVLTSHATTEAQMTRALARIGRLPSVAEPPRFIRIERPDFDV